MVELTLLLIAVLAAYAFALMELDFRTAPTIRSRFSWPDAMRRSNAYPFASGSGCWSPSCTRYRNGNGTDGDAICFSCTRVLIASLCADALIEPAEPAALPRERTRHDFRGMSTRRQLHPPVRLITPL